MQRFIVHSFLLFGLITFTFSCGNKAEKQQSEADALALANEPSFEYGLQTDSFLLVKAQVRPGESLGQILERHRIDYGFVDQIVQRSKEVFDVRTLNVGKNYTVFCTKDSLQKARCFVYEASATDYVVFDFRDSLQVYKGQKEIVSRIKKASGVIHSSLYQTMIDQQLSPALAMELSDVYAWTIDFFRIQKGDHFKVIYEDRYIDDTTYIGIGRVKAVTFNHFGEDYYAFYFEGGENDFGDYYDEEGNTLRRAFLKAPLKFSRISSRYSPRRFHPVQKRWKPHLGTDYAAPTGTPIMSTADGVIEKKGYTRGNGNYVKVQHNSTYATQYLHMSRIKKGIKRGVRVQQGDVIGYVGSTGLATGPHVCYRFWKNGKQVDPYKQDLPAADPIKEHYRKAYNQLMLPLKDTLLTIPLDGVADKEEMPLSAVSMQFCQEQELL